MCIHDRQRAAQITSMASGEKMYVCALCQQGLMRLKVWCQECYVSSGTKDASHSTEPLEPMAHCLQRFFWQDESIGNSEAR